MRKISFFAGVVAVLVLIGVGTWIGVGTGTSTPALAASTVDPSKSVAMDGTAPESIARRLMSELARDLEPEVA